MNRFGDVRYTEGTPVVVDFGSRNGTPLITDILTGTVYYLNAAGAVAAVPTGSGTGGYPPELGFSRY